MKERFVIASLVVAVVVVASVRYYTSNMESSGVFASRLMNVVIPHASFADTSLTEAANEIWRQTASMDPYFASKRMVIHLEDPDRHVVSDLALAQCPSREWLNYLCQTTNTTYQIFDEVIYITDIGREHDRRPWLFVAMQKLDLWVYVTLRRFGRKDPNDPFG